MAVSSCTWPEAWREVGFWHLIQFITTALKSILKIAKLLQRLVVKCEK
jgi:hypothetical protein